MSDNGTLFTPAQQALLRHAEASPREEAARLLSMMAAGHWRAGERDRFVECVRRANALVSVSNLPDIGGGTPPSEELAAMAELLLANRIAPAEVIAQLAIARAALGRADDVRALIDFGRFFHSGICAPPDGESVDAFNDALAAEIKRDLVYYEAPVDRAIRKGWRHNGVLHAASPALRVLRQRLTSAIADYVSALPRDDGHPFVDSRPETLRLKSWAVVSGPQSHHISHIHPDAWATGVYYVTQPAVSRDGQRGWLEVGPPRHVPAVTPEHGWEKRMIEPKRGSFVLMPAYFYHATDPMECDDERICVAFEVQATRAP
jgi:uncharacterized protein (TIGR02466 family)